MTNPDLEKFTNEELYVQYAESKDVAIRNELMIRNQPLVAYLLNKSYSNATINEDTRKELMQEGTIGLLHAIDGFDHTLGFKFSTYGMWWIKQAVNNYLINVNPIIRVPSHIRAAQNKLQKKLKLTNKDLRDLSDISPEEYDLSPKMLKSIQSALKSRQVTSLNKPVWNEDSASGSVPTLEDTVTSDEPDLDQTLDKEVLIEAVKSALKIMPDKRRLILLLRYDVIKETDVPKNPLEKKKKKKSQQ